MALESVWLDDTERHKSIESSLICGPQSAGQTPWEELLLTEYYSSCAGKAQPDSYAGASSH